MGFKPQGFPSTFVHAIILLGLMALQALIFDVDGTLAETEEAHRQAFNETFLAHQVANEWPDPHFNWVWDRKTYRRLLKTTGGKERIAAYLEQDLGIDPGPWTDRIKAIHVAKTARLSSLLAEGGLDPRPGIETLLSTAREAGLALAIATTTSRPNVDAVCRACFGRDALDVFDVVAAGDEVDHKKPAPDVYLLALERLGRPAEVCLAIEDSLNGLRSAHAAHLRCLVSPSFYCSQDDMSAAECLIPDFSDITLADLHPLVPDAP